MKNKNIRHLFHYLILLGLMTLGITVFTLTAQNQNLRIITILYVAAAYLFWGIIHHLIEKTLYPEVVFEYLLFSLLGLSGAVALIFYL